ncbi:MAG: FAD:protein FMN transferase [Hominenteromicrobium sp.]
MKAKPVKTTFWNLSEQKAKRLAIVMCAVLLVLIIVLALLPLLDCDAEKYEVTTYAMGSYVQQTVYGDAREAGAVQAADDVQALENKISWRVSGSDIQKLNDNAGQDWITLSGETMEILAIAQDVAEKSGGAFDVTIAPISRLWDFDSERREVPADEKIRALLPYVDYTGLRLDAEEGTASLRNLNTAVDLGAVGKGAACDAAVKAYGEAGVQAAIVSVGGSVGTYGTKPSGAKWNVAVRDPNGDGTLGSVSIASGFLSTSGSYEKCFTLDGKTYHHLLDPETGYPAETGLVSVTVWSDSGTRSDALSTACFVLGLEKGAELLAQYGAEGIFIDENGVITVTDGLKDAFELTADGYTLAD